MTAMEMSVRIEFTGVLAAARMMNLDDGDKELYGCAKSLISCELDAVREELLDSFILWHASGGHDD